MAESLFDLVRESCAQVAARSEHVHVNEGEIDHYAVSLPLASIAQPRHDPESHYLGQGDDTLAFFVTLDAINFGSGYFPRLRKRANKSGYFTIATCLTEHFQEHGPLTAEQLATIDAAGCTGIFEQDVSNVDVAEQMGLFAAAWNQLGTYLLDRFDGSFAWLVASANESAEQLTSLLIQMPFFDDVSAYRGQTVQFYKRAQLTAADLNIAFDGQGPGSFRDLDRLTIFADNLVPHVLRLDGILEYEPALLERINREELIPAGSEEEVEIRACAVHAVEQMVLALQRHGHVVHAMQLDYLLWNRGQTPYYKSFPRHRTRTVFY